jgi:general secretion pathway protein H
MTLHIEQMPSTTSDAGFTLLEALVVLAILVLTYSIAMPRIGASRNSIGLPAQSAMLGADLRTARSQAISENRAVAVDFNVSEKHYTAPPGNTKRDFGTDVELEFTVARQAMRGESGARIVFFGDGSSTGGHIKLTQAATTCNIDVIWLSGSVSGDGCRGEK